MIQLLTYKEACAYLNISPSTLYRYTKRDQIPYIKKSFGLRFRSEDLEKWILQDSKKAFLYDHIIKKALTNPSQVDIDKSKGGGELSKAKTKTRQNYGYGAIYIRDTKSGRSRFYADYRDRSGKRIQKLIKNAQSWQEAHDWLKDAILKEHYKECGQPEQMQPIKLDEFVDMFIKNYSRPNKRSWKDDNYRLKRTILFFGKNTYLDKLSPFDIDKFKSVKIQEGLTPSTINTYLRVMKRMFNIAITWGYVCSNPVREVRLYSEAEARRVRVLAYEEEDRLLESASERLQLIIILALNTGMRRGEILRLKWEDINLVERTVLIKKAKSGKPRTIPINSRLLDELMRLKKSSSTAQNLFINLKTGKPLTTVRKPFATACEKAGIQGFRFHDLRRTFGSRLALAGVDLNRIKELLGHASIKTTEIYLHADQKDIREAVEVLCQNRSKSAKKQRDLLHICDMEPEQKRRMFVSSMFSVN